MLLYILVLWFFLEPENEKSKRAKKTNGYTSCTFTNYLRINSKKLIFILILPRLFFKDIHKSLT